MIYHFRITVCLVGGLLFLFAGCGAENDQVVQEPQQIEATTTPNVSATPTPVPIKEDIITHTPTVEPSPTGTPLPTTTPTIGPMAIPTFDGRPYTLHTVQAGHTMLYIADRYDITIDELVQLNNLSGPEAIIQIDQSLRVPLSPDIPKAPVDVIWPDSEVVYSPAYVEFDVAHFIDEQNGYLDGYTEYVDGTTLTAAEVIERVAERFSVGPRVLLTVLEHYGSWVTNPNPTESQLIRPAGDYNPYSGNLYLMLGWTAKKINGGYYGYKRDGYWLFKLADYTLAITPDGLNAGTVGMQNLLALHSDTETWQEEIRAEGLMATYQTLFGDTADYAMEGYVVPSNLTQPSMTLPWEKGEGFYFTSGPHIAYIEGSAWAAIDFGSPDVLGSCLYSDTPNTAVADGTILVARQGEVQQELDNDGHIQTGWVVQYLHMALDIDTPVEAGQAIKSGHIIGYASCEGGEANASHLHISRRYNGEWIEAGGAVPFDLSGWVVQPTFIPYEGAMIKGDVTKESCECWKPEENLIIHE